MEKINFEKISLRETNLHMVRYEFYNSLFRKYNITKVSQILDGNLMNKLIAESTGISKEQLKGLVSLINYKYLGQPIPIHPSVLEITPKTIEATKDGYDNKYGYLTQNKICYYYDINFYKLGLHNQHIQLLHRFIKYKKDNYERIDLLKLIDIFKEISCGIWYPSLLNDKCPEELKEILTIYVDVYEGRKSKQYYIEDNNNLSLATQTNITITEKESTQQEIEKLSQLKEELLNLIFIRDDLDIQIENIKSQIRKISNDNKKRVLKKEYQNN